MASNGSVLTRSAISFKLNKYAGFSDAESKAIINDIIIAFQDGIINGGVNITNIGSFTIKSKGERMGRNPKNLKKYPIKARKVIKFTPSKNLKTAVNG